MPSRSKGGRKNTQRKTTYAAAKMAPAEKAERGPLSYDDGPLVWVGHLSVGGLRAIRYTDIQP